MQKVLWTKGALLTPQHLQLQDRFLEDQLRFQLDSLVFAPWGFNRLQLDPEALASGNIAVTDAAGLFPDGLPFEVPGAEAAPAERPIEGHWRKDANTLEVYFAIPELRRGEGVGGHNVSLRQSDRHTRFIAEYIERRDENDGRNEKSLQVARKNLRFLFEGEALEGHSVLPVARIQRSSTGGFEFDPTFIPPVLDLAASDNLLGVARRLVEVLSARSASLSALRRQRSRGRADFGVAEVHGFWLLYTVNTWLPEIRHIYETRRGHPAELFASMLSLAGALTTFAPQIDPRELPGYEHNDLGRRFAQLETVLMDLLEEIPSNAVTIPLGVARPSVHEAAVEQDRYFGSKHWYLAVGADLKPDELARRVTQFLKVSSADRVDRLIRSALPGVRLSHVPSPPSALPIRLDLQYFALDLAGADWDAIRTARTLAVYVPSEIPAPRLELILLLPPNDD